MIIEAIRSFLPKTYNDRQVRKLQLIADEIDALEPEMESKSNEELQAQTDRLRSQVNEHMDYGLKYKDALEAVLPEAFATVRRLPEEFWENDTTIVNFLVELQCFVATWSK